MTHSKHPRWPLPTVEDLSSYVHLYELTLGDHQCNSKEVNLIVKKSGYSLYFSDLKLHAQHLWGMLMYWKGSKQYKKVRCCFKNFSFKLRTKYVSWLLNLVYIFYIWEEKKNCKITITLHAYMFSHGWLFATPWTIAHQAPLSMEFSRQEYWSG